MAEFEAFEPPNGINELANGVDSEPVEVGLAREKKGGSEVVCRESGGYDPSGLYHGPRAVLAACKSCLIVCIIPSSASTLHFKIVFSSARVDIRELFTAKNPLMDS